MLKKFVLEIVIFTDIKKLALISYQINVLQCIFITINVFCVFNKPFVCFHFLAWFKLTRKWPWTPLFTDPAHFPHAACWGGPNPVHHGRPCVIIEPRLHTIISEACYWRTGTRGANMAMVMCQHCWLWFWKYALLQRYSWSFLWMATSMRTFRTLK